MHCGGTIISEFFIVTATHCLKHVGTLNLMVRVGDYNANYREDSEEVRASWEARGKIDANSARNRYAGILIDSTFDLLMHVFSVGIGIELAFNVFS